MTIVFALFPLPIFSSIFEKTLIENVQITSVIFQSYHIFEHYNRISFIEYTLEGLYFLKKHFCHYFTN